MKPLTELAHNAIRQHLLPDDVAIDATAGNGYDTGFLAECVGPSGYVYAFDIQAAAIQMTKERLQQRGNLNVGLLQHDHADMISFISAEHQQRIAAVMFNLGYLPGGDKGIMTEVDTTLQAIRQSLQLLKARGMMTIIGYTGHPGGKTETEAVHQLLLEAESEITFHIEMPTVAENAPVLFLVCKTCE